MTAPVPPPADLDVEMLYAALLALTEGMKGHPREWIRLSHKQATALVSEVRRLREEQAKEIWPPAALVSYNRVLAERDQLRAALRMDKPWPFTEVLIQFHRAVVHFMDHETCDMDGWEMVKGADVAGQEILAALALPSPPSSDREPWQDHHYDCDVLDIDPAIGRPTKPCNCQGGEDALVNAIKSITYEPSDREKPEPPARELPDAGSWLARREPQTDCQRLGCSGDMHTACFPLAYDDTPPAAAMLGIGGRTLVKHKFLSCSRGQCSALCDSTKCHVILHDDYCGAEEAAHTPAGRGGRE